MIIRIGKENESKVEYRAEGLNLFAARKEPLKRRLQQNFKELRIS